MKLEHTNEVIRNEKLLHPIEKVYVMSTNGDQIEINYVTHEVVTPNCITYYCDDVAGDGQMYTFERRSIFCVRKI